MEKELTIILPPQGSMLREYLKTAFYYADPIISITPTKDGFILRSHSVQRALASAVRLAKQMVEAENTRRRENKKGEIRFPLTGNDSRHTIGNIMKYFSLHKKDPLEKLFDKYERYLTEECSVDKLQDSFAVFNNGYPNDSKLTTRAAAFSVFKPEHYERGRSLGYFMPKHDVELGIHSTILGMAGYVLSKIGNVEIKKDEYVSVLIAPEDISKRIEILDKTRHIEGMKKMRGEKIPGIDPPEALVLWLGAVWKNSQVTNGQSEINIFLINEPSRKRKSSSVYSQMSFNLRSFMTLAEKIDLQNEYALNKYKSLLRHALYYDSDKKEFAIAVTKKIFQVIDHIASPEELVYFAARESLKLESSNSEDKKFYKNVADVAISIQKALESTRRQIL